MKALEPRMQLSLTLRKRCIIRHDDWHATWRVTLATALNFIIVAI